MHRILPWGAAAALVSVACAHATRQSSEDSVVMSDGRRVITEQAIAHSGARTVWDALRRTVPFFNFKDANHGRPGSIEHRGRSSIVLRDQPVIILDGVELSDFTVLGEMPATDVSEIEVLTGIDATTYYGTNATKGVIRIRTKVHES